MTTFQAIVYGIVQGFSEFLPISASGHHTLVAYFFNWPVPTGALHGALSLGSFIALLLYFRHDWASLISSTLEIIVYRKRPMSLDERLPLFILVAAILPCAVWYYLGDRLGGISDDPLMTAAVLAGAGLPLWFSDSMNRRNKGMFDWNWLDALVVGVGQCLFVIPGAGRTMGAFTAASTRNYNREAAAKFMLFAGTPLLAGSTILRLRDVHLSAPSPMVDVSWLTFSIAGAVSLLASLLAIGAFMKHIQRGGMGQYFVYRCLLAVAAGVVFYVRTQHPFG
ncbi:MAG: hypothetical protein H7222_13250 [Methylotenera sp.]|nr:hypothetical protein [Oligoflexia bacterium]